ncbi:nitrogen regulatory protein P-II GLNB family [Geomicrobium sp. JCM 19037]|uniref:cyclic-di-AMP receptor n=1 Tax=unclassified Geomicrobium TaxID=2628951 RepID=UPI00045F44A2|nr:cyclic-di-AMP receptor [Geomicrobium sp. JCM 19037]GAK06020.1 nitrogen regulatory protein P-II GLNB family [Geomicrobium sp. JCM 19037]
MKLLVCIINDVYRDHLEKVLQKAGYRVTELASSGGFLRKGNTTFLIGFKDQDLQELNKTMQKACEELEKKKKIDVNSKYRYTSFIMNASQSEEWASRFSNA